MALTTTLQAIVVASVAALAHAYLFYPLSLLAVPCERNRITDGGREELPTVVLAICAYNEREVIAEKVENSLALDYPDDRLEVVVVSDGSTDGTDGIVESYADRGVSLLRIEGRVGKTACQNRLVEATECEVIVFSDANSFYEPDAIRELVAGFEKDVGCVVGDLRYARKGRVAGEAFYWRYEQFVKRLESRVSTLVTGTGGIYAVRRDSYVPLRPGAISDFAEPLSIVDRGERVAFTEDAVARERMSGSIASEIRRRVRIATRAWHTGRHYRHLLDPRSRPLVAYQLLSHRGLLGVSPLLVLAAFVGSKLLSVGADGGALAFGVFVAGIVALVLAALGWLGDRTGQEIPAALAVPYYFVLANYGLVVGLANCLRDRNVVAWETEGRGGS